MGCCEKHYLFLFNLIGKRLSCAPDPTQRIMCIVCQAVSSGIFIIELLFLEVGVPRIRTFYLYFFFFSRHSEKHINLGVHSFILCSIAYLDSENNAGDGSYIYNGSLEGKRDD